MNIYKAIRLIRSESPTEDISRELVSLVTGDHCVTPEDRCVALVALCESLLNRIESLESGPRAAAHPATANTQSLGAEDPRAATRRHTVSLCAGAVLANSNAESGDLAAAARSALNAAAAAVSAACAALDAAAA